MICAVNLLLECLLFAIAGLGYASRVADRILYTDVGRQLKDAYYTST